MPYSIEQESSRTMMHFRVRESYSVNSEGFLGQVMIRRDMKRNWYVKLLGLTEDVEAWLSLDGLDPMISDSTVWRRYFTLVLDRSNTVVLLREKYKGALSNYKEYMRSPAEEEEQMNPEEILTAKGSPVPPENLYDLSISFRGLRMAEVVRKIDGVDLNNGDSFNIYKHEED